MPAICPNCLAEPADTDIPLYRSFGVPFAFASTTSMRWPFCRRCARWVTRPKKLQWLFAIGPALLLLAISLALTVISASSPAPLRFPIWILFLASLPVSFLGSLIVYGLHAMADKPDTCIANFPTVRPIRRGVTLLKSQQYLVIDFAHPIYVDYLIEINPGLVEVNLNKLRKRIDLFERRYIDSS